MFTMTGSRDHSVRKRMLSNIYSKSVLQTSQQLRLISQTVIVDRLLPILSEAATSQTAIDMHDVNQGLTMDFVSAYLFGLANGTNFLQNKSFRQTMLQLYQCRKPFEFYHQEVPALVSWARSLRLPLIPKWCDDANNVLDSWGLGLCDKAEACVSSTEARAEPVVYRQLKRAISRHLPSEEKDPESHAEAAKQQRYEIACEMYDHLTAGHETSAVALTYMLWEISKHPNLQDELRAELETLLPPIVYRGPSQPAELPSPKSIDALPLLDAIVTETLRLHAPIPGIQPRVTPAPSCTLAGYSDIPPNTRVNAQAYSLHRNPDVFPEPEIWQPKRWLKSSDEPPTAASDLDEMRRWFWAFGSGGRMCVGSNLALQGVLPRETRPFSMTRRCGLTSSL